MESVGQLELEQTSLLKFMFQITNVVDFGEFLKLNYVGFLLFRDTTVSKITLHRVSSADISRRWLSCSGMNVVGNVLRSVPPGWHVRVCFSCFSMLCLFSLHRVFSWPLPEGKKVRARRRRLISRRSRLRCVSSGVCGNQQSSSRDPTPVGYISSAVQLQLFKICCASSHGDWIGDVSISASESWSFNLGGMPKIVHDFPPSNFEDFLRLNVR